MHSMNVYIRLTCSTLTQLVMLAWMERLSTFRKATWFVPVLKFTSSTISCITCLKSVSLILQTEEKQVPQQQQETRKKAFGEWMIETTSPENLEQPPEKDFWEAPQWNVRHSSSLHLVNRPYLMTSRLQDFTERNIIVCVVVQQHMR